MYTFIVNGKTVSTARDERLLTFLREELGLTSVKNGCSEGACGTCMILIDGKATKACVQKTSKMEGREVITCEGLTDREKDVYAYAFTHCGAVQCGFCTPGMVISAKGLIDANPDPTREEVKFALRNNICRCTGYKKIEDAVLLAARMFREGAGVPHEAFTGRVGENLPRVDAPAKAIGTAEYADDIRMEGMLLGGAVRSDYPRAIIKGIDISEALEVPGVVKIVTAADLPGELKVGHLKRDQWVLVPIGGEVHFCGDPIVLIAAETTEALNQARALVKVDYEVLKPVLTLEEAMAPDAPVLQEGGNCFAHEHLVRGDAEGKLKASKYVVTTKYHTPPTEHAFLETETAVAAPEGHGVVVYSGDQGIYQTRRECADATGLPQELVRVVAKCVGGGFGGKEDMSVQHHAAVLAHLTQRPVKVAMTRKESMLCHPKRHGFEMEVTTGCDENGRLTAMIAILRTDSGAFASLGGPVLQRACTHAAGPYNYQDIIIDGKAFYTNNPPCGAFRGFGVTQSCFAAECNLNKLAELVGISPFEIRYRNAIRPGQVLPNGQIADEGTALVETLDAVRPYYEANPKAGIACAMKNAGLGVGIPDTGRVTLHVEKGVVHVRTSAACIGQGIGTITCQIVCEVTGLRPDQVTWDAPDTSIAPNSGNTTASRQTLFTGEATRRAATELKWALEGRDLSAVEGVDFHQEYTGITDKLGSPRPNPISHIAYGYATHLVELDDEGKIKRVIAAHDVGRAVNPVSVEGQIEGGVVMSLGYALTEDFPLKDGRPTVGYASLGLFRAHQTPDVKAIIVEKNHSELACGAKGIGEICSIPTAPAVQLAYYNYDGKFRTSLPLADTPYSKKKK
ncbi:selenium-dependent xanthine dehydrogenase [uncultured Pseudoflavonifractor sp.]|uniref:selenium-dependent xanthine dehydrogenase n=1 Tax=uncultured Pseudoflavonifractor sp. TaxID=1221379 RepID=UPI0025E76E11|nr:selenium-dependent xanthine dehydrogenase [uncultured Pseudoflavonifractor sp.]